MSTKRKQVVLTIEEKLHAVKRIKNEEILYNVAADLRVGVSTVTNWVKAKDKLGKHYLTDYEKINEAVFLWFTQEREKGTPLNI